MRLGEGEGEGERHAEIDSGHERGGRYQQSLFGLNFHSNPKNKGNIKHL